MSFPFYNLVGIIPQLGLAATVRGHTKRAMRHTIKILFGSLFIIIFQSCKFDNGDNEIELLDDIFLELTSIMHVIKTYPPPPPPPAPILDSNDSIIGYDTIEYQLLINKYKIELEKIEIDTQNIVLAISDSLFQYHDEDIEHIKKELPSSEYFEALNSISDSSMKNLWLDIKNIHKTGNYQLRYLSEFPKRIDIWTTDYSFNLAGIMSISRIYFDSERQFGIFYCSYNCGGLCGSGNIICTKKVNGKWKIEKTISRWIS
jgi:hypothetical protein